MQIDRTTHVSPNHDARPGGITAIVLHHGAGTRTSDLATLVSPRSGVSAHYYVCRDGTIYQLVPDDRRAWHAGKSRLGRQLDVNDFSLGIELEHQTMVGLIQHTDWPPVQLASLTWLIRTKAAEYRIPAARVVSHRAVALPAGRKSDPAHAPLAPEPAFRAWVDGVFTPRYTAGSPLLAPSEATLAQLLRTFPVSSPYYTDRDIQRVILPAYVDQAAAVGLDPVLPIAQMAHETGALSSWWCDRPRRNPAGIGVNGQTRPISDPQPTPFSHWHADVAQRLWRFGLVFDTWVADAIPCHLGRLLAYALPEGEGNPAQERLIATALDRRPLPDSLRGCAPTLQGLEDTWATDGDPTTESFYADRLAIWANRLVGA